MDATFWQIIDKIKPLMADLKASEELNWSAYAKAPKQGVYVLYEDGNPIYVGRSNRMRERINEHGADSSDRHSATFAFRLLREALGEPEGRAQEIESAHKEEYRQQRKRVQRMTFRAVEITDQVEQTIFEIYAILEMKTPYNDFETH